MFAALVALGGALDWRCGSHVLGRVFRIGCEAGWLVMAGRYEVGSFGLGKVWGAWPCGTCVGRAGWRIGPAASI